MARWATVCEVAGISFTGCRVELVNAEAFKNVLAGSVDFANDGTPHVQVLNRGVKGIQFGLKFVSTPQTDLTALFAAIDVAQGSNNSFTVEVADGLFDIDIQAVPDYTVEWFTYEKHSEGWYENVVLRFISIEEN